MLLLLLEALVACLLLDQAMHMIYSHVAFHLLSLSTAWLLPLEALVASLLLDQALHTICSHGVGGVL